MQVEVDEDVCRKVQSLTSIKLDQAGYKYFADWLVVVGVETVKVALEQHPELTLGDLVMMQYRDEWH